MESGDWGASADKHVSLFENKELRWSRKLDKDHVRLLAFKFAAACQNFRTAALDPDLPIADLVKDFVVGYSTVTPIERASLQRLLTEYTVVSGKKHLEAAIFAAAWRGTTKDKAFYESLSTKGWVGDEYFEAGRNESKKTESVHDEMVHEQVEKDRCPTKDAGEGAATEAKKAAADLAATKAMNKKTVGATKEGAVTGVATVDMTRMATTKTKNESKTKRAEALKAKRAEAKRIKAERIKAKRNETERNKSKKMKSVRDEMAHDRIKKDESEADTPETALDTSSRLQSSEGI